jgi:hypothetical protein
MRSMSFAGLSGASIDASDAIVDLDIQVDRALGYTSRQIPPL